MIRLYGAILSAIACCGFASAAPDDSFPPVDSHAYCRMIMDSNPAADGTPGLLESCIQGDAEVAKESRARWDGANVADKVACREIARLNGHYSYQLVLGCIRYREQKI